MKGNWPKMWNVNFATSTSLSCSCWLERLWTRRTATLASVKITRPFLANNTLQQAMQMSADGGKCEMRNECVARTKRGCPNENLVDIGYILQLQHPYGPH